MSRCVMRVLMFVCRHNVEVCDQLTSRQVHLKVQKGNAFSMEFTGKFNVGVEVIKIFLKTLSVCLYHVSK